MAGAQVTVVANQIDKQRLGYQAISLTHFADTLECKIAAGSKVEIGGALFEFTVDEAATGWAGIAISSDVYIKLVVSGASVTAVFTTTAPTWDTAKQGWYSGGDRYIGGLYKDASSNYTKKYLYRESSGGIQSVKEYGDGTGSVPIADLAVTTAKLAAAAVTSAKIGWVVASGNSGVLGSPSTYVLSAGLYWLWADTQATLQVFVAGGWRAVGELGTTAFMGFSDGTNVRINKTSGTGTVYWIKLS